MRKESKIIDKIDKEKHMLVDVDEIVMPLNLSSFLTGFLIGDFKEQSRLDYQIKKNAEKIGADYALVDKRYQGDKFYSCNFSGDESCFSIPFLGAEVSFYKKKE